MPFHVFIALCLPLAFAAPYPQTGGGVIPSTDEPTRYCPTVDSQVPIDGPAWQLGVSAGGNSTITNTEIHSVGTTITSGGDIGFSTDSISIGLTASVAHTVTDSTAEGGTVICPSGLWWCSVLITPGMMQVNGHMQELGASDSCHPYPAYTDGNWQAVMPRTDQAGNGVWSAEVCACQNKPYGLDAGAPKPCIEDCA